MVSPKLLADIYKSMFPEQQNFVLDNSKFKIAHCSRRSGKSYSGAGLDLLLTGLKNPGCEMRYFAGTKEDAKNIIKENILEPLNNYFNVGLDIQSYTTNFPNGSRILIGGLDAHEDIVNKYRGGKPHLIVVDECQDIEIDLENAINKVFIPALADNRGRVILLGTSSDKTNTYFYKATHPHREARNRKDPSIIERDVIHNDTSSRWSYHCWLADKNPYVADSIDETIAEEIKLNPNYLDTDSYLQEWLALWVVNKSNLVFRYNEHAIIDELPKSLSSYRLVLGVDVGFNDPDAYVTVAYSYKDKCLYVISIESMSGNSTTDTADNLEKYLNKFNYDKVVVDGADKKGLAVYEERFGHIITAAEKQGKREIEGLFNKSLQGGSIKILRHIAPILKKEWSRLIYDKKNPKEHKNGLADHISDALLYAWRYSYNWLATLPEEEEKVTYENFHVLEHKKIQEQRLLKNKQTEQSGNEILDMFGDVDMDFGDEQWI